MTSFARRYARPLPTRPATRLAGRRAVFEPLEARQMLDSPLALLPSALLLNGPQSALEALGLGDSSTKKPKKGGGGGEVVLLSAVGSQLPYDPTFAQTNASAQVTDDEYSEGGYGFGPSSASRGDIYGSLGGSAEFTSNTSAYAHAHGTYTAYSGQASSAGGEASYAGPRNSDGSGNTLGLNASVLAPPAPGGTASADSEFNLNTSVGRAVASQNGLSATALGSFSNNQGSGFFGADAGRGGTAATSGTGTFTATVDYGAAVRQSSVTGRQTDWGGFSAFADGTSRALDGTTHAKLNGGFESSGTSQGEQVTGTGNYGAFALLESIVGGVTQKSETRVGMGTSTGGSLANHGSINGEASTTRTDGGQTSANVSLGNATLSPSSNGDAKAVAKVWGEPTAGAADPTDRSTMELSVTSFDLDTASTKGRANSQRSSAGGNQRSLVDGQIDLQLRPAVTGGPPQRYATGTLIGEAEGNVADDITFDADVNVERGGVGTGVGYGEANLSAGGPRQMSASLNFAASTPSVASTSAHTSVDVHAGGAAREIDVRSDGYANTGSLLSSQIVKSSGDAIVKLDKAQTTGFRSTSNVMSFDHVTSGSSQGFSDSVIDVQGSEVVDDVLIHSHTLGQDGSANQASGYGALRSGVAGHADTSGTTVNAGGTSASFSEADAFVSAVGADAEVTASGTARSTTGSAATKFSGYSISKMSLTPGMNNFSFKVSYGAVAGLRTGGTTYCQVTISVQLDMNNDGILDASLYSQSARLEVNSQGATTTIIAPPANWNANSGSMGSAQFHNWSGASQAWVRFSFNAEAYGNTTPATINTHFEL